MKKKKKKIVITITIIIIIMIFFTIGQIKHSRSDFSDVDDFYNIKELVEYYECIYYKTVNSEEDGYRKDIYISFGCEPIDEAGVDNKYYYENLISLISAKMSKKNYRIIDESRSIIIRITFNKDGEISYTINGDKNYFSDINSKYSISNMTDEKEINLNVISSELQSLIDNKWVRKNTNLGTTKGEEGKYVVYEEGYKVRTLGSKVYNIIFTEQYENEVFENIKTGMDNSQIVNILGDPLYENDDDNLLKGYKTKDYYVFFRNKEISVYRVEEFDKEKNEQFAAIFTELCKTGKYNVFIDKLTDIYPNYSEYTIEENKLNINYPLLGFKINMGYENNNGLTIYDNYIGKVLDNLTIDDIKNGKSISRNIYLKLNSNLMFEEELKKLYKE